MKKLLRSFLYALKGIAVAFSEQQNLRIHAGVTVVVIAAGFYFGVTAIEWCMLVFAISLVVTLEMVNSAIENVVDLITREFHPLAGKVKDIAAGAVLVASVGAIVIGVMIFWKY